jgi:hypothetical protein
VSVSTVAARLSPAELLAELGRSLAATPREDLPDALAELERLRAAASLRLSIPPPPEPIDKREQLVDAPEAARRLNVTEDWVRRHTDELPFTVRLGRKVRFSVAGLDKYVRLREGR